MKKLFFSILIVFSFFLPSLVENRLAIPADALLSLYHPWRDLSQDGYTPGRFPAKNMLITDPILQTYPLRNLVIEAIQQNLLPLWNPYNFAGQPLLANIQSGTFQITNVLFLILPFNIAWSSSIVVASALTALFMFLFLRELDLNGKRLSPLSCLFAATVLPFTGFYIAWLEWGTIVTTAMWLPLILLAQNKLFKKITTRWFIILTIAIFQTLVSGHLQTANYVLGTSVIYLIYLAFKNKIKPLILTLISIVLAILIAAPQLLPTVELISLSSRDTDQSYDDKKSDWFLPPQNLIQLVAPDFFGNPTTNNYWGIFNYGEFVAYIGIVPLFLALVGAFSNSKPQRFFVILSVLALILALKNPVSELPYSLHLPLISSTQPSRIIFLLVFSLTALSAFGFDYLFRESKLKNIILGILPILTIVALLPIAMRLEFSNVATRNLILPFVISALLLILLIARRLGLKKEVVMVAILLLCVFDLFRFAYKFLPFSKESWIFPQTSTTTFLNQQPKPFRIITTSRMMMHPATNSVYRIESVDGYDPLYLASYARYVSVWLSNDSKIQPSSFGRIITPQLYQSNFADLLNVKYILSLNELDDPNLAKVHQEGETRIYENKKVIPRIFFADEVIKKNNLEEELEYLVSSEFDPLKASSQDIDLGNVHAKSEIQITNYNSQSLSFKTTSDKNAPLVVTNINYPGWEATVDGTKTNIYRGNYLFQLMVIPEGTHEINLSYRSKSLFLGLYLAAFGLASSVLVSLVIWRRKFQ